MDDIQEAVRKLFCLPEDAPRQSIPYRQAWAYAARELGRPIAPEDFEAAVKALVSDEFLARRAIGSERPIVKQTPPDELGPSERELMPDVEEWLRAWLDERAPAATGAEIIDRLLEDTSKRLPTAYDSNAHPDFLAVALMQRQTLLKARYLEATCFELKASNANINAAVQQAANQHHFAHYAYLVWHVDGERTREDDVATKLKPECERRKLGLITFREAADHSAYQTVCEPERKSPDEAAVEKFVAAHLTKNGFGRLTSESDRNDR